MKAKHKLSVIEPIILMPAAKALVFYGPITTPRRSNRWMIGVPDAIAAAIAGLVSDRRSGSRLPI
jgi:hypothetical protein